MIIFLDIKIVFNLYFHIRKIIHYGLCFYKNDGQKSMVDIKILFQEFNNKA